MCTNTYECVFMDQYGCVGVKGVWGHTKPIHEETKNGRTCPDLDPMAGEISPDIMFCDFR